MAWTQADVDALKAAIKTGVRTVAYSDQTVTYQPADDMLKILGQMEAEVNANSGSPVARFSRISYSRE